MLDSNQLFSFQEKFEQHISVLNRTGELESFIKEHHLEEFFELRQEPEAKFETHKNGKILVIGASETKKIDLINAAKKLGITEDRLEFHLEYEDAKTFDFEKMRYNSNYAAIMLGPQPHSGISKGSSGSVIAELKKKDGYPPAIALQKNSSKYSLGISKSNFSNELQKLIGNGAIDV